MKMICRHPNIVRMYGCCLEPPTVCLILELLPLTLSSFLYPLPSSSPHAARPFASTGWQQVPSSIHGQSLTLTSAPGTWHSAGEAVQDNCALDASDAARTEVTTCSSRSLTVLGVLQVCADIAAGLAYLHSTSLASQPSGSRSMASPVRLHGPSLSGTSALPSQSSGSRTEAVNSRLEGLEKSARIVHRGGWC
jgi:hypothetical protein